jgi:hypothetical protein
MTAPTKYVHNVLTGVVEVVELTKIEIAERAELYAQELEEHENNAKKIAENIALKKSAYEKLGLTEEEIKALLPEENA